jgi:hypothetical protein
MSLVQAFNRTSDGGQSPPELARDVPTIVKAVVEPLFKSAGADDDRRTEMRRRLDFYRDRGTAHVEEAVKAVWKDPEIQADHLSMVPYARFHNLVKKIARVSATVYSQPAKRRLKSTREQHVAFLRATRLDLKLRESNRFVVFVNEVFAFVGKRKCREKTIPTMTIVTPESFTVVKDPDDPRVPVAVILDAKPGGIGAKDSDPHHVLWSDDLVVLLDKAGKYLSHRANPYKRIPGALIHRAEPVESVLDPDSGRDILDAQLAVALLHVMKMRGHKVGTKVPYATGDMSTTAHGQVMDHTKLTKFEEGVSPGVLDLGYDPAALIASAKSIIAQVAANYDIPEDVYTLTDAPTSGFDRQLKRIGLDERRAEQIPIFRDVEHELAEVGALVAGECDEEFRYQPDGFGVDFGEVRTPQDPIAQLTWRKEAKAQLLRTTIDDLLEDNPDYSPEEAELRFQEILAQRAKEVELQRALNMPRDPTQAGQTPEENGAKGPPAAAQDKSPEDDNQGEA